MPAKPDLATPPACEDAMTSRFSAPSRLALLLAGAALAASLTTPAGAQSGPQYDKRGRPVYSGGPNVQYQQGNTRLYVSKRSWLDGGTEVLPGERKYTDYAFPPTTSFGIQNRNRPLERQPLNPASDLGGEPTRFPLY
jgi:hypothetical protein